MFSLPCRFAGHSDSGIWRVISAIFAVEGYFADKSLGDGTNLAICQIDSLRRWSLRDSKNCDGVYAVMEGYEAVGLR